MIYCIFKCSEILSWGKVTWARMGAFVAKERKVCCRMFGVQNKVYLVLRAADNAVIRLLAKFLSPFRHTSGLYGKMADLFHVIRNSSLVINLPLRIMQLAHFQTHR
jgi:hypothetical protein